MAVPKHKTSKQRTHTRKANWKISKPSITVCKNCGEMKATHRACRHCGYYNDEQVVEIKQKDEE